jgi:hypothetical protein
MGSHRLPDSHPAALPTQPPAAEPEPGEYRGGRRSTNAEPLAAEDYHGRRHRTDGYDVAYSPAPDPGRSFDGQAGSGQAGPSVRVPNSETTGIAPRNVPAVPVPDPTAPGFDAARVAAIGDALDEVAAALAKLAAALRS